MRVSLTAGFFYFLIVFFFGLVLGGLREVFVTPTTGHLAAVLMELPLMLAISWYASRLMVHLGRVPAQVGQRLLMGVVAFALLMLMEQAAVYALRTVLVVAPADHGPPAPVAIATAIGFAAQVVFALFPLVQMFSQPGRQPANGQDPAAGPRRERGRASILHRQDPALRS